MDRARKLKWSNRVKELRDLIDSGNQIIYSGNWQAQHNKGWRWVLNMGVKDDEAAETIKEYQLAHGKPNVSIGHPFNEHTHRPSPADSKEFGLYVRDVEDLVQEINNKLDDPDAVARWLNGETNV